MILSDNRRPEASPSSLKRIHEDLKPAAFATATMGTPAVTASLLLTGFFAYSLFPTLLISMLRFPAAFLSLGVNLLTMGLSVRWRLLQKTKWASASLTASIIYLALHAFFFYLSTSLGR